MIAFLEFVFRSGWVFAGTVLLVVLIGEYVGEWIAKLKKRG